MPTYMGYPRGWSQDEFTMFLSACFEFWMLPRSGFRFRKNTNSCCWPAQRPRTHSLFICRERQRERERERESIYYLLHTHSNTSQGFSDSHTNPVFPPTHTVTLMTLKLRCRLYSIMILYSSVPSSIMCLSVSSVSRLDNTALRHVGSLSWQMTRLLR